MSHSSLDDLKYFIALAKKVGIPFIIDTEGSQIRTGDLRIDNIALKENDEIKIYSQPIIGKKKKISFKPEGIIKQLEKGDLIHIDFDVLILRVSDVSTITKGYITAKVVSEGILRKNKAVVINPGSEKKFNIAPLSKKDLQSIKLGLQEGIKYIAASFMRSKEFVDEVRKATQGKMKIISKIECIDALEKSDEIIQASDFLLLDRGDLSKEIPIEKIPLAQKIILHKAHKYNKGVFVATNLLETMIYNKKPTRAEVNDVVNTILDGAYGLTLAAETAIGKYPMECINMLNKLIAQAEIVKNSDFKSLNCLLEANSSPALVPPHGGNLVNRILRKTMDKSYLDSLPKIKLNQDLQMDVEQIAIGTFSPIEGFMNRRDLQSVLDNMRLANGTAWTIPILLDVTKEQADKISIGQDVALIGDNDEIMAILHVEDKYQLDKKDVAQKLYGTNSIEHPGVRWINTMQPVLLGGKVDLIKRRQTEHKEYELTPRQVRRLFAERGWSKIVGFHTRNVIHKSHEFIQLKALEQENCDGLFIHPVIGKKKPGDFHAKYIIKSYEQMIKHFYPKDKVVFATFSTFSRYAGPREAIFTALCRKNFGCSHFVVGRDHTGIGNFYPPKASHEIFDKFPDLGIKPVIFDQVFYSRKHKKHIHEPKHPDYKDKHKAQISGTQAREMLQKKKAPPEWFMRPEISKMIIEAINKGEEVFVKEPRAKQNKVIWFTGLSGSGKTTIALKMKEKLESLGKSVEIIDGDIVRNNQHKHLGFSRKDIRENNKLIAELVCEKKKDFDFILVPIISPYKEDRAMARTIIGNNFFELFINASLQTCINRDAKGLYKKALAGEINNFIGISDSNPYEAPDNPDIEIKSDKLTVNESVEKIVNYFKKLKK
jgi:ATP sulfurylase/adenylyl-sulfate kinase